MKELRALDVVILAGGKGTRLLSAVPDRPKCLAEIAGRPLLHHQLDWARSHGARRVLLALGFRGDQVLGYLESRPVRALELEPIVESEPLGTGGALANTLPRWEAETALVLNGDSLTRLDPCELLCIHRKLQADVSIAASWVEDARRYGSLETDEEGRVLSYSEKSPLNRGAYVSTGIYVMERGALERVAGRKPCSLEQDLLPHVERLFALKTRHPFLDIGTPESFAAAEEFLAST